MAPTFLQVCPPVPLLSLPVARRVTAAAPPPSWARRPSPNPGRVRAAPPAAEEGGPILPSPRRRGKKPFSKGWRFLVPLYSLGSPKHSGFPPPPWPSPPVCYGNMTESHPQLSRPLDPGAQGGVNASPSKVQPEAGL